MQGFGRTVSNRREANLTGDKGIKIIRKLEARHRVNGVLNSNSNTNLEGSDVAHREHGMGQYRRAGWATPFY
jgi:hypothetical protein